MQGDEDADKVSEERLWRAYVYAYELLGFMVTSENRKFFDEDDLAAWDQAVNDYLRHEHGEENGTE